MNITIKPKGKKEWTFNETEVVVGKKTILLSSVCAIKHRPFKKSLFGGEGTITLYQEGKYTLDYTLLAYNEKHIEDVKKVSEYILSIFNNENFDIDLNSETGKYHISKKKEYVKPKQFYKKCNTCGHIYCYTQADLNKNKQLKREAAANSFASAFGPAIMSATYNQTANDSSSRIIDYDKCPKCNSADVISITEEEVENLSKTQDTQQGNLSQADELKKFKELLDMGAITEEEFEAKKKQLLGL